MINNYVMQKQKQQYQVNLITIKQIQNHNKVKNSISIGTLNQMLQINNLKAKTNNNHKDLQTIKKFKVVTKAVLIETKILMQKIFIVLILKINKNKFNNSFKINITMKTKNLIVILMQFKITIKFNLKIKNKITINNQQEIVYCFIEKVQLILKEKIISKKITQTSY